MGGFRRRVLSILLGPFVLGIGFCILLAPPPAVAAACRPVAPAPLACCERGADGSCPAPERAPSGSRCQVCDGSLQLSAEEKAAPSSPGVSDRLAAPSAPGSAPRTSVAEQHLHALSTSPPLHLRNEAFRN